MSDNYKLESEIDCKQGAVRAVRFSVDGAYCITGGSDRKVKLWNPYTKTLLKTYNGHGEEVMDCYASCDSSQIISCGLDKSVILWDVATATPLRRFRGHAGGIMTVRFNEESSMAVSGSRDNSVMFWDIRSRNNNPIQSLNEAKDAISSVRVSDHEILTASFDCRVRKYDIRAGQLSSDCLGEPITCSNFTRDGQCIVNSCADGVIRLLDKHTGELLNEYQGYVAKDLCLESDVAAFDSQIISGSADGKLYVWNLINQNIIAKLFHDDLCKYPVVSVSVHPEQNYIIFANGSSILLWSK